ncbi:MAG: hypothetical protein HY924_04000 [Elusimicrobia bacterium]|nr:hypothetical protein [Elusimicrobiota bacterium]
MKAIPDGAARFLFAARSLPLRWAFLRGRASFVDASLSAREPEPALFTDFRGKPLRQGLDVTAALETVPPLSGPAGWRRCAAALRAGSGLAALRCSACGHLHVLRLPRTAGRTGSFAADRFSFRLDGAENAARLTCLRCERTTRPGVQCLRTP